MPIIISGAIILSAQYRYAAIVVASVVLFCLVAVPVAVVAVWQRKKYRERQAVSLHTVVPCIYWYLSHYRLTCMQASACQCTSIFGYNFVSFCRVFLNSPLSTMSSQRQQLLAAGLDKRCCTSRHLQLRGSCGRCNSRTSTRPHAYSE